MNPKAAPSEEPSPNGSRSIISLKQIITIGLAIFSMYFGAGNLMFPIGVGVTSGSDWILGILGFITTAVMLPLVGLIAMVLFDGDYNAFFGRLGKRDRPLRSQNLGARFAHNPYPVRPMTVIPANSDSVRAALKTS